MSSGAVNLELRTSHSRGHPESTSTGLAQEEVDIGASLGRLQDDTPYDDPCSESKDKQPKKSRL